MEELINKNNEVIENINDKVCENNLEIDESEVKFTKESVERIGAMLRNVGSKKNSKEE